MPPADQHPRVFYLDGVRTFAVLAVIIQHYAAADSVLRIPGLSWGLIGVHTFFVLSGFLITTQLQSRYRAEDGVLTAYWRFAIARAFRIVPLVWLALLVLTVLSGQILPPEVYWVNLAMAQNLYMATVGQFTLNTGHFWSVGVEIQLYLVFPWLYWALPRRFKFVGLLLVLVALYAVSPALDNVVGARAASFLPYNRADAFLFGALLAATPERWRGVFAVVCLCLSLTGHFYPVARQPYFLVPNLCFVGFLAAIPFLRPLRALLEMRPIVYLGQVSYGIFVWHLIAPLLYLPTLWLWIRWLPEGMLYWTINLTYTMVFTIGSWYLFELPMTQRGARLSARMFPRPPSQVTGPVNPADTAFCPR